MPIASFRSVAVKMDSVATPRTARSLADIHRWLTTNGKPPVPLSLSSILARHVHPQKIEVRFLWYNTYLLDGVAIPVGTIIGMLAAGLLPGVLADWIGVTKKPRIGEKPARERRGSEIGYALAARSYDIAALCEVFNSDDRDRVLASFGSDGRQITSAEGPEETFGDKASGLLTIVVDRSLHAERHEFDEVGDRFRDSDAWSNKGVLRTVVDFGIGSVEVYSTHLFNGGWTADDIPEDERAPVQDAQLDELIAFFEQTHEPQNVALIVGDFNIDAHNQDRYGALMERMGRLRMEDLWAKRNGQTGETNDFDGEGSKLRDFICPLDVDHQHCVDLKNEPKAQRIDYIFVEKPRTEHAFVVDFTRPRRVPFKRPAETDGMMFMSDHIGLETTLIVTPKGFGA